MGIETDLNISPYFDDFDPEKDFHQVLYNSGLVLQARELTQSQSIIHDKIAHLGKFNLTEGSVLEGCNFSYDPNVRFVRVRDTEVLPTTDGTISNSRGLDVDVEALAPGMLLSGETSGAVAEIVDTADGYETDPVDTKTVFYKFVGKRTAFGTDSPEFESGENILAVPKSNTLLANVVVAHGGSGYATGNEITVGDAMVTVTANSSGVVTAATVSPTDEKVDVESILVSTSSVAVSGSVVTVVSPATEAKLNFNFRNSIRLTAIDSTATKPVVGFSYQFSIENGYIWQKGTTLRVTAQNTIVSKYGNRPNDKAVVFDVKEEIVTHASDQTLLDNAHGFHNENAPGADRLKLTPKLDVVSDLSTSTLSDTHTKLVEFRDGKPVRINQKARLGTLGDILARQREETQGDYVVEPFNMISQTDDSETENGYGQLYLSVSSGLAYVKGYRQEYHHTTRIPVDRGFSNTSSSEDQTVSVSFDNYVLVEKAFGSPFTVEGIVYFVDGTAGDAGNTTASLNSALTLFTNKNGNVRNVIGKTWIRGYEVDTENHDRFKAFLIGSPPDDARGVVVGDSSSIAFFGDISTVDDPRDNNVEAIVRSSAVDTTAIFPLGHTAVSNVHSAVAVYAETILPGDVVFNNGTIALPNGSDNQDESFIISFHEDAGAITAGMVLHGLSEGVDYDGATVDISDLSSVSTINATIQYAKTSDTTTLHRLKTPLDAAVTIDSSAISSGTDVLTLGVPDAYGLTSVTVGTTDRTSDFILGTGQTDSYYGTSFVTRKSGSELTGSVDVVVEFKHFRHAATATDKPPLFTKNSYPSDFPLEDIPIYTSTSGARFDMRDCADFRPSAKVHADVSTVVGAAVEGTPWTGTIDNDAFPETVFNADSGLSAHVVANSDFSFDVDQNLGRIDLLELSKRGEFSIVAGEPSLNPVPPYPSSDSMVVTSVDVPPFPALDVITAQAVGRTDLSVRLNDRQRQRLTQANLGGIRDRVRNLEYYASLNLLERNTSDLVIRSEIDQTLNRFKHGIFVDNFENLTVGDFRDREFKVAVDPARGLMQPRFRSYDVKMEIDSPDSDRELSTEDDGLYGLTTTDDEIVVSQAQATTSRVCTGSVYNFRGDVNLKPNYDNGPDTTRGPVKTVNLDIDTAGPALAVLDEINTILVDQFTEEEVVSTQENKVSRETSARGNEVTRRVHTDTTTTTTTTRSHDELTGRTQTQTNTQKVGDFVTDVSFQRYIRAQRIAFIATGLMPNIRHWVFFDGEDATSLCRRKEGSSFVGGMVSSKDGEMEGEFNLPSGRFFVGDRNFIVLSEPTLDNRVEALSAAAGRFSAYNFSSERSGLDVNLTTRKLDIDSKPIVDEEVMKTYRRVTAVSTETLNLSLTPRRATNIVCNWNRITGATGYTITRSNENATDATAVAVATITNPSTTTRTITGLVAGASYAVEVETNGL